MDGRGGGAAHRRGSRESHRRQARPGRAHPGRGEPHASPAPRDLRARRHAGPLRVGGFLGWWIWLFIHIAFLTGYRNRLGALLTWWLAFSRDIRRERTFTTQEIGTLRDIYASPPTLGTPDAPTVDRPGPGSGDSS